jgi:hypothetical protein
MPADDARPRLDKNIFIRASDEMLRQLAELCRLEKDVPSRNEMIRRLIERAVEAKDDLHDGSDRNGATPSPRHITQAEFVIEKLGGVSRAARALGHKSRTTVQGWRDRGWIHPSWYQELLDIAAREKIDLKPEDFTADVRVRCVTDA